MDPEQLKEILLNNLSKETKKWAANICVKQPPILEQVWLWLKTADDPLKWRACWIFEEVCIQHNHIKYQYLEKVAKLYTKTSHESLQRMLGKILTSTNVPDDYESIILNTAFERFQDPQKAIAVRVHAMQIAFNLVKKYPDLKNELKSTIQHYYDTGSRGFKSRAGKLLAQL